MSLPQPSHESIDAILPLLPHELRVSVVALINDLTPSNVSNLENLVRILIGSLSPCPGSSAGLEASWGSSSAKIKAHISSLSSTSHSLPLHQDKKRIREDEDESASKRPRVSPPATNSGTNGTSNASHGTNDLGNPLFTLHSVSTTSPIRKKVDITIHSNAITLVNPTSRATEATLSLSSLRRAFVVPTRGKTKAHWTVILMGTDFVIDEKKTKGGNANHSSPNIPSQAEQQQLIFGLDASSTAVLNTSTYPSPSSPSLTANPKGTPTLPLIKEFLSHLPPFITPLYPTPSVFKSACPPLTGPASSASPDGIPGVEAYKGAKVGTLWFMKEGILWGESKPCEFWSLQDVVRPGKAHAGTDGIKVVGSAAGGRTCSVVIMRKDHSKRAGEGEADEDEEDGDETEFGMIDGRERDGIQQWIHTYRARFGWKPSTASNGASSASGSATAMNEAPPPAPKLKAPTGPTTIHNMLLEEDEDEDDDDDFKDDESDSESGSDAGSTSSEEEQEDEAEGSGGDDDDDDAEDAEGDEEEEDAPLDPAKHPLMQPGAMPKRISKPALEMAAALVQGDLLGRIGDDEDEDMEDQLDE